MTGRWWKETNKQTNKQTKKRESKELNRRKGDGKRRGSISCLPSGCVAKKLAPKRLPVSCNFSLGMFCRNKNKSAIRTRCTLNFGWFVLIGQRRGFLRGSSQPLIFLPRLVPRRFLKEAYTSRPRGAPVVEIGRKSKIGVHKIRRKTSANRERLFAFHLRTATYCSPPRKWGMPRMGSVRASGVPDGRRGQRETTLERCFRVFEVFE